MLSPIANPRAMALAVAARRSGSGLAGVESEKTGDERASGVLPLPDPKIEHERDMAGKAGFAGGGRKGLHEACLADPGFAPNADNSATAGVHDPIENRV